MFYVKVYYQKCPDCGQTWSTQLSQAKVIRLGKEVYVCKCNKAWPTGHVEWVHLTPEQRRQYFFSTAEIGVLVISVLAPALFGFFVASGAHWTPAMGALVAASYGFLVGLVFVAILWALKMLYVRLSLRRCAHENAFEPRGALPWQW